MCTHQLTSLSEMMFLHSRTSEMRSVLFNEIKNKSFVFLTGDWNAKQHVKDNCTGSFAFGVQTNSGQHLVNFCTVNSLFISNTTFQHKAAHITSWENKRVHSKDLTKTITVYNQIDYILCNKKITHTLINARNFSRAKASSNNCLVICKLQVEKYKIFKNVNKTHSKSKTPSNL